MIQRKGIRLWFFATFLVAFNVDAEFFKGFPALTLIDVLIMPDQDRFKGC